MDFQKHELIWTDEKIRRFWDWMSNEPAYDDQYFSKVLGGAIVDFAVRRGNLPRTGAVLDFGCGPGNLLEKLLESGIACSGAEFSQGSIQKAFSRLSSKPGFGGIIQINDFPIPKDAGSFDFIFLIETVEHIKPEAFDETTREIHRLLKPRGRVMITTPYREDLKASGVLCSDCGAIFHRMQHLRSWSDDDLRADMERRGFRTVICEGTDLLNPGLERFAIRFLRNVKSLFSRKQRKTEHLIYIGEK